MKQALNRCTVQWSTTAVHVYEEHTELFSLAQGKNIQDKICREDCQASSWIRVKTSLPKLMKANMTKIRVSPNKLLSSLLTTNIKAKAT